MKTIIVPTDFSASAANATNYAMNMALQVKASVLLVHAYQLPIAINDDPPILISIEELQDVADTRLAELKKGLEHVTPAGLKIETVAQLGTVNEVLRELCEKIQPFVVIMGATGHSGLDMALFGSTLKSVIKHLTWPVIGVPRGKEYGHGIKNAGLVVDFRELTQTLPLAAIRSFTESFGTTLYVLNLDLGNSLDKESKPVRSPLLESAFSPAALQYHFNDTTDIDEDVNGFVEKNGLDILISIHKKHTFLETVFKKDATNKLLFHSSVPLMSVT
ncbi:MAG TPA: universal stress protein [Chitinophagaceae bacterium]|nr:universal stress protein [Chitinophagaceae bacterium]